MTTSPGAESGPHDVRVWHTVDGAGLRVGRLVALIVAITATGAGVWGVSRLVIDNQACCQLSVRRAMVVTIGELAGREYFGEIAQDKWVLERVFPGVSDGWFVDVGSGHGRIGSNTRALEHAGWRGVCIDPFPVEMAGRTCEVVRQVVSSRSDEAVAFKLAGGLGGIADLIAAWNATAAHAPVVHLPTTTLSEVLARHAAPAFVHFVSLDIEGAELEALLGFPFATHHVGAWAIEHNGEEPKRTRIRRLLESHGYRLVHSWHQDDFYVGRDIAY